MVIPTIEFFEGQKKFLEQSNTNSSDKKNLFSLYNECIKKIKEDEKTPNLIQELQKICDEINKILQKIERDQKIKNTDNSLLWLFLLVIIFVMITVFIFT